MATHNQTRTLGYLLKNPTIINEGQEGAERILFRIRTTRRKVEGYQGKQFEDVIVYYDDVELMDKLKKLKEFDVVDIKGVFNVLTINKPSICPYCGTQNIKYNGSSTFIYPISVIKIDNILGSYQYQEDLPKTILKKHYEEVSNQVLIIGTVVSPPEMIGNEKMPCCRYRLGVDRKYYIKTQDNITADYPWVYTYGQQAEWDYVHLKQGSLIHVDAFMHSRQINAAMTCEHCGCNYVYPDVVTEFIPHSLEYLNNYITDEDIALAAEMKKREQIHHSLETT